MSENVLIISSDCHAGALPSIYNEFMPKKYTRRPMPGGSPIRVR